MQPINGLPQEEVAVILKKSLVFLAFGHPEGFGLPLAEAAASGCYVIGYSGLGGRELLELACQNHAGREIAYGDWLGFLKGCEELDQRLKLNSIDLAKCLIHNSKATRETYSPEMMVESVKIALKQWELQMS